MSFRPGPIGLRRGRRAAAAVLPLLVLAGCGGGSAGPAAGSSPGPVAKVGSTVISSSVYQARLASAETAIVQGGGPSKGTPQYAAQVKQLRASVLRSLIIDAVIAGEAQFRGIAATDTEVQSQLQAEAKDAGGMDHLRQQLSDAGGSIAQLQDEIRSRLNEQRLEDAFARERAGQIAAQLAQGGDFVTLARQLSDDISSRDSGGLVGTLTPQQLDAGDGAFAAAAKALQPGQTTAQPVRDDAGYELLHLDAVTPAGARTLRHIIVAAPRVYRVQDRPAWFSESVFEAIAQECAHGAVHVYIPSAGQPCATPSATPGASPPGP